MHLDHCYYKESVGTLVEVCIDNMASLVLTLSSPYLQRALVHYEVAAGVTPSSQWFPSVWKSARAFCDFLCFPTIFI